MFNDQNYPKSYGSTKEGFYRLNKFLELSNKEIKEIEGRLWDFIWEKSQAKKPKRKFKNYKFIGAGWEWSVFLKNDKTIIKIPAEIFPEVKSQRYLNNTRLAYQKIKNYFPSEFIATSKFYRDKNINILEQNHIKGKDNYVVGYNTKNKTALKKIIPFLKCALNMLQEYEWLPDFDIKRARGGFTFKNVIFEINTFTPKIIDFTSYYDVYRMYPTRKDYELKEKARRIKDFLGWINNKTKNNLSKDK